MFEHLRCLQTVKLKDRPWVRSEKQWGWKGKIWSRKLNETLCWTCGNVYNYTHTHLSADWMDDRNVFKRQGRIHNKARSMHMDAHTQPHVHAHTGAQSESPLPGHFALERAEKLMRVQSFITLETESEWKKREEEGKSEGNPVSSLCYSCHGNPHLTVGTDFWVSRSTCILSGLEHNTTQLMQRTHADRK